MNKSKLSSVFSYALAMLLCVLVFAVSLCVLFVLTVASPKAIDTAITQSDYVAPLRQEISAKWENLASICGMQETKPLLSLLNNERVENDCRQYFKNAYNGETLDTASLKNEVYRVVSDYAHKNDLGLISQAELEQNIKDLVNSCMDEYDRAVKIRFMPKLLNKAAKLTPTLLICLTALTLASVGIIIFIFYLQADRKKTLLYVFYALGGNALFYLFMLLFVWANDLIKRIPIEESALYNLSIKYLSNTLNSFILTAAILLIASAVILILYLKHTKSKKA